MRFSLLAASLLAATGYRIGQVGTTAGQRACAVRMFETSDGPISITRSRESRQLSTKTGRVVVTDGSGSFYKSRDLIQTLHNFGTFRYISAFGPSVADSKKSLMTRNSRYSGLNDVLTFEDGEFSAAMTDADAWLAINADVAELPTQLSAAKAAGVSRVFLLFSDSAEVDAAALDEAFSGCDTSYTLMRTGSLVDVSAGGGLKLADADVPVCEDVSKEDVFRFVTEALTLPEAASRAFSLCPSDGTVESLKQVRYAGYERREEVQMLLSGLIKEQEEEGSAMLSAEEQAEKEEAVLRSSAEVAAEREEELKMLLARARKRGEETQARLEFEAAEKLAFRQEQEKYYKAPSDEDAPSTPPVEGGDDKPEA